MSETTVDEVMAELAELEDPKIRAVNEKHGDDHGVNLTKLRAVAKRLNRCWRGIPVVHGREESLRSLACAASAPRVL